jgi:hypothetical protein
MPGRIGKTYPRVAANEAPLAAPAPRRGLRYRVIGWLLALFSALGVAGWLIFR